MAVVTISRQMGSQGGKVARLAAKKLGYTYADRDLVEKVFRQYGLTKLNDLYAKTPSLWELFNYDSMLTVSMLNEVMQAFAKRGDTVIVGRGGFAVLAGLSDVLHVRIEAPQALRIQRTAQRNSIDIAVASSRVAADDAARAKFTKLFYGREAEPSAFDLVLDTEALSVEEAADRIVEGVRALSALTEGPTAAALAVDPVLAEAVQVALQ